MKFYKLDMDGNIEEVNGTSRKSIEQKLGLDAKDSKACVLTRKEMEYAVNVYCKHKGSPTGRSPWFYDTLSECSLQKGAKRQFVSALMKYLQDNAEGILGGQHDQPRDKAADGRRGSGDSADMYPRGQVAICRFLYTVVYILALLGGR